jgi:hypothetical protein
MADQYDVAHAGWLIGHRRFAGGRYTFVCHA